jgi:hypothetical protein
MIIKITSSLFIFTILVTANEYFAKVEPLITYNIKSTINGEVIYVNDKSKGYDVVNSVMVKLNTKLDIIELRQIKHKIKTLNKIIKLEKNTLNKFKKIRSKSQLDKDNQNIKILNLENQLNDLITKKATLEDKISNKTIKVKNRYISNINVKVGDYINAGTLLYTANDLSKAKLIIYLPIKDAKSYLNKTIYIDNRQTKYKINTLYKIADSKHISSFKCEIIIDKPALFSTLVKIEFK